MTNQNEMPEEIYARNDEGMPMWSVEPQGMSNGSMPEARYIRADLQSQTRVDKLVSALHAAVYTLDHINKNGGDGMTLAAEGLAREALKEFEE